MSGTPGWTSRARCPVLVLLVTDDRVAVVDEDPAAPDAPRMRGEDLLDRGRGRRRGAARRADRPKADPISHDVHPRAAAAHHGRWRAAHPRAVGRYQR